MLNVMAENIDDVCSFIGKSNSSNNINLKQIDLTQIHHQQQIFGDAEHITTTVSTPSAVSLFHQFNKYQFRNISYFCAAQFISKLKFHCSHILHKKKNYQSDKSNHSNVSHLHI